MSVKLEAQRDFDSVGSFRVRNFREVGNHILSVGELGDDVIVDHDFQSVWFDVEKTGHAVWVDLLLLKGFLC